MCPHWAPSASTPMWLAVLGFGLRSVYLLDPHLPPGCRQLMGCSHCFSEQVPVPTPWVWKRLPLCSQGVWASGLQDRAWARWRWVLGQMPCPGADACPGRVPSSLSLSHQWGKIKTRGCLLSFLKTCWSAAPSENGLDLKIDFLWSDRCFPDPRDTCQPCEDLGPFCGLQGVKG